ncbi:MAG: N-acetyl-gamma-glutamyl-phosphate reductase [Alphaproteobacteria bacterium]|nr:N-acetyl-gamma-glutamyl-phosphate reductase [Alphaproteobacteria bacterium]
MTNKKIKVGVVGASGYTGSDLVRLAARHPNIEIKTLTANTHAGKTMGEVFPHLGGLDLPALVTNDEVNWQDLDAVFCGLPHATSQQLISGLPNHLKIIDMSADFRLRDANTYAQWYGHTHAAPELQKEAVYGLSEHYRDQIAGARLVACPGCYPTAALMLLLPVVNAGAVDAEDLIIDAKSGVSGAGRSLKQNMLFCEAGEGMSSYAVGSHRHAPEIEQELSLVAGRPVTINFTPHLVPMSRCEYLSVYARLSNGMSARDIRELLIERYADEPFVRVLPEATPPATQHIRGSNTALISIFEDRIPGRVIMFATLDNLVKGSAGQAVQNFNLMYGIEETTGLEQVALFP